MTGSANWEVSRFVVGSMAREVNESFTGSVDESEKLTVDMDLDELRLNL